MKTQKRIKLTLLMLLCFYISILHAQRLSITDQKAKTEESVETDSWTAHLDQDVDDAQKSFADFMEKTFKLKTDKKAKNIYSVDKARLIEISSMRLDVRAVFQSESGGSAVSFIFSPGYDVFLSNDTYKEDYLKAQGFVKNYVRFHYTAYYNKVLENLVSKIKDKESAIKSDENKIDKLKSSIAENDAKINAADPNSQKLKDKNAKSFNEIVEKNAAIERLRTDINNLQDEIIKTNNCLKLVADYK